MNQGVSTWQSLQTRMTLLTLGVFLAGLWLLTLYISRGLRDDIQSLLGAQQFSTVGLLASQVNQELEDRLTRLESVGETLTPTMLRNGAAVQRLLDDRPVLRSMFNRGIFATRADGKIIADAPLSSSQIGVSVESDEYMRAILSDGKRTISRPELSAAGSPHFVMAVPIRDAGGALTGVLAGRVDLGRANFLDRIMVNRYGKTGGYFLAAPQYRLNITAATEKNRIMQPLPAPGVNPAIDRFVEGYEGTLVYVNQLGENVLVSAKDVPIAGWKMIANLPTAEAFAPIRHLQERAVGAAILVSLLASLLTWWVLRRQLAPLLTTAKTMAALSETELPPRSLPIVRLDEIGQLIRGFNHMLEGMTHRDDVLREREQHFRTLSNGGSALIWTSGLDKLCDYFNEPWLRFTGRLMEQELGNGWTEGVHLDDLSERLGTYAMAFERRKAFSIDYRLRNANGSYRWVNDEATPRYDSRQQFLGYIGFCKDITERKEGERASSEHAYQLQALSRRVLEMQEAERRHLAIELHDELGQSLTAIKINLMAHEHPPGQLAEEIKAENIAIIDNTLIQVRRLALGLRPSILDDLGLVPAMRWLAEQAELHGDLVVQFNATKLKSRLTPGIEIACFRVVQEALTNIQRHAQAFLVTIDLYQDTETLMICVQDDGCGFDPTMMQERALTKGSIGMVGMRERAMLIGGTLDVRSAEGEGSTVRLCCPLHFRGEIGWDERE